MFFRNLRPKKGVTLDVTLTEVHLPVKLGHRDATKIFADPLKKQLAAAGLGSVLDCRLRTRNSGDVIGVDLTLGLTDPSLSAQRTVAGMLEYLAAPCGSSIRIVDGTDDPVIFGVTEGLELSIGTNAAPDADARRDLAMTCRSAMEHLGVSRGWVEKQGRTHFYFYGESFVEMRQSLAKILEEHPRFAQATLRRMA